MYYSENVKKYLEHFKVIDSIDAKQQQSAYAMLMKESAEDIKKNCIDDPIVGRCLIAIDDDYPGAIIELVNGVVADDLIMSFYQPSTAFTAGGSAYYKMRKELIEDLAKAFGQGGNSANVALKDDARGRHVLLSELSTAQLIDLLSDSQRNVQLVNG